MNFLRTLSASTSHHRNLRPSLAGLAAILIIISTPPSAFAAHGHRHPASGYGPGHGHHAGGLRQQNIHRGFHSIRHYPSPSSHGRTYSRYASPYGNYGVLGQSSYVLKSYRPLPFPYYTPRIYVVPQPDRGCLIPSYTGPAYRNVLVMRPAPNPAGNPALEDQGLDSESIKEELPQGSLAPPPIDPDGAWSYLADGDHKTALSAFSALAAAEPDQSLPKAGFGLAAALSGDKITAAYALRLAFESKQDMPDFEIIDPTLREALRLLSVEYRDWVLKKSDDLNARFVYGVISHWSEDNLAARTCIQDAIALGDESASAANLVFLIDQALLAAAEAIDPSTQQLATLGVGPQ